MIRFGEYEVNLDAYELTRKERPVPVEPRVFSLLAYLIDNHERLVTKEELLDELWGHRYVGESALSTQIKSLRKAVGDDGRRQQVIQTVRGRGYQFVAPIENTHQHRAVADTSPSAAPVVSHNLPRDRTPLFGRSADVERCARLVNNNRLVTILGIGGIGKTRLASSVGRATAERFADGVWFVDLIPLTSLDSLETTVANVLGMTLTSGETRPQLIEILRHSRVLLIFDNCEHLRAETATLIDSLLEFTESPHILTTSRDPLDLIDEHRFFLNPLPVRTSEGTAPAVALFRATSARHGVNLEHENDGAISHICDRLDGLPLAIELAAAQLRHLTLDELKERLDQRFDVLAGRERGSSGRRNNLVAVLEDTWRMLSPDEQHLLAQLAAFPSRFLMSSVEELFDDDESRHLSASVSRLVDLGLIQRTANTGAWWRVLETVRVFATQGLDTEQRTANARRHARWCLSRLGRFPDDQLDNLSQAQWCLDHYPDLEAAELHFHNDGDAERAYALCSGNGLMIQLDDGARAKARMLRAQAYIANEPPAYWRARLHAIAGLSAQANRLPDLLAEHTNAYVALARDIGDPELLANALLMQSLTTGFVDPDLAHAQLNEMIALGQSANNPSLVRSGTCYRAWQYAVGRDYDRARAQAELLAHQYLAAPDRIDNPAYNAIGNLVACSVVSEPETAARWAKRLHDFPAVLSFWGVQNIVACVEASNKAFAPAARRIQEIRIRLNRAGRDDFPDTLVTAAVLAHRRGDTTRASRWLAAIRYSGTPIQMYHAIIIYRQLYSVLGFGDYDENTAPGFGQIRSDVHEWLAGQIG